MRIGSREHECVLIELREIAEGGWRATSVEVACGTWRGRFGWMFYRGQCRQFARDLERLFQSLVGEAKLEAWEQNLQLTFRGDGKGHIAVSGRASEDLASEVYLVFALELDQTELPAIIMGFSSIDPV